MSLKATRSVGSSTGPGRILLLYTSLMKHRIVDDFLLIYVDETTVIFVIRQILSKREKICPTFFFYETPEFLGIASVGTLPGGDETSSVYLVLAPRRHETINQPNTYEKERVS